MGLDASVPCRCWQDGLTSEPPFSRDLLVFDDGFLSVRNDASRSLEDTIRMDRILYEWLENCCPHPQLEVCGEWVGNWSMVRTFSGFVAQVDHGQLPTLRHLMPPGNGGEVSSGDSARALLELVLFLAAVNVKGQPACFLVDSETGEEVFDYVPAYQGQLVYGPRHGSGFDPEGVWVRQDGIEVFRATRVTQRVLAHIDTRPIVELIGDNGATFTGAVGFTDDDRDWEVKSRPLTPDDVPCVDALGNLFQASVLSGNPIYWR